MLDRKVKQIHPEPKEGAELVSFGDALKHRHVILLGDPGAGKSHLFEHAAADVHAELITVRNFLNRPGTSESAPLFLDALDEKRAGRGDQDTIDLVVRKLHETNPSQIRLSCRIQDWLGETDLAALKGYFKDDCAVFVLQSLSKDEQVSIIKSKGVDEAPAFIKEAESRGLIELLENPQTLTMLIEVAKNGEWPKTRKELFDRAANTLLEEHNKARQRAGSGIYTPRELRNAAGAICAARIIADTEGISLSESSPTQDTPTYRSITTAEPVKVLAALCRRAFKAGEEEIVDYVHRTVAEFLAAEWLAEKIRNGLPLGRVLSLIGVDGIPTSALRGLHAWLPVFLPEHASQFLKADPYGTLVYGDAASLTLSDRRLLLEELAKLSEADPWFLSTSHTSSPIGGLASDDMVEPYVAILTGYANAGLKTLVLESLKIGTPPSALRETLLKVLKNSDESYYIRCLTIPVILKLSPPFDDLKTTYHENLHNSGDDIRLRAELIFHLFGQGLTLSDVEKLLSDASQCTDEIPTGSLLYIDKNIPTIQIAELFDRLSRTSFINEVSPSTDDESLTSHNSWELAYLYDRLLSRLLDEEASELVGSQLWGWLVTRHKIADRGGGRHDDVKQSLLKRPALITDALIFGINSYDFENSKEPWRLFYDLHEIFLQSITNETLILAYCECLERQAEHSRGQLEIFEQALSTSQFAGKEGRQAFEALYHYGEERAHLAAVLERQTFCTIPDWRKKAWNRKQERDAQSIESVEKLRSDFIKDREAILAGAEYGWMAFLARKYLFSSNETDQSLGPHGKLEAILGKEHTQTALDALVNFTSSEKAPEISDILELRSRSKYSPWWYAIVAGLDEMMARGAQIDELPDSLLRSALLINLYYPSFPYPSIHGSRQEHPWLTACLTSNPNLVAEVYAIAAGIDIRASTLKKETPDSGETPHIHGLYELLHSDHLKAGRIDFVISTLRSHINLSSSLTERLIKSVIGNPASHEALKEIAKSKVNDAPESESYSIWLCAGFIIDFEHFHQLFYEAASTHIDLIWNVRNFEGYEWGGPKSEAINLSTDQIKAVIQLCGSRYPNEDHPRSGWSGDTNSWDAAEYIRALIGRLSTHATQEASIALEALLSDNLLKSYENNIRHALGNQRSRYRDAIYRQPDWDAVLATLNNQAPANPADLHALLISHIEDLAVHIASSNTRIYAQFWNEKHKSLLNPKPEDSGRDVLALHLRNRLFPLGINVEPEGYMASEKRADIVASKPGLKAVLELKRDYHSEVWTALTDQLDRLYTRDPDASGYGIYVVFWFGEKRGTRIPKPIGKSRPASAKEMQDMLNSGIAEKDRKRLAAIVIDVSGVA